MPAQIIAVISHSVSIFHDNRCNRLLPRTQGEKSFLCANLFNSTRLKFDTSAPRTLPCRRCPCDRGFAAASDEKHHRENLHQTTEGDDVCALKLRGPFQRPFVCVCCGRQREKEVDKRSDFIPLEVFFFLGLDERRRP